MRRIPCLCRTATTFAADGSFDEGAQGKFLERLVANGIGLYLGSGGSPSNEYLVKFSHGPTENPSGTLAPGQKVTVKDGMRFRVAGTGES